VIASVSVAQSDGIRARENRCDPQCRSTAVGLLASNRGIKRYRRSRKTLMTSNSDRSRFCSVNSIRSCINFLNEELTSIGIAPRLILPPEQAELSERRQPLAERNSDEGPQTGKLQKPPATEYALAEALNVIFALINQIREQPLTAQYYDAQVRALRAELDTQQGTLERLREEKLQVRTELAKAGQIFEKEREQMRRLIEEGRSQAEALRRQNAELSDKKLKAESQSRQLQSEIHHLRSFIDRTHSVSNRNCDDRARPSSVPHRATNRYDLATTNTVHYATTQQNSDMQSAIAKAPSVPFCSATKQRQQFRAKRKASQPSPEREPHTSSPAERHLPFSPKAHKAKTVGRLQQSANNFKEIDRNVDMAIEFERLTRECDWLRHQLDWYRVIVAEQEELLTYAISHS